MKYIEKSFSTIQLELKKLHSNQVFLRDFLHTGSKNIDLRIDELHDNLGDKPSNLEVWFETPSLWGTIGELCNVVSSNEDVKVNS